ncbi:MAG: hypothetical protein U0V87_18595 [Acidobacteriota bacterium]
MRPALHQRSGNDAAEEIPAWRLRRASSPMKGPGRADAPPIKLVTAPDTVDTAFLHHARTYVPFGHAAGGDEADAISIVDYEKRLITKVIEKGAPRATSLPTLGAARSSTALYTWDRCRRAGLLAVPPFQLGSFDDLIHAAYGWSRYGFKRTAPGFVPELEALYARYSEVGRDRCRWNAATAATYGSPPAASLQPEPRRHRLRLPSSRVWLMWRNEPGLPALS